MNKTVLAQAIKAWGQTLGFDAVGIADIDLSAAEARLSAWLAQGFHGSMGYMAKHGLKRSRPALLEPGTASVIVARMDYLNVSHAQMHQALADDTQAYISCYALGRDYHKVLRKRLQRLANQIADHVGPFGYRVFVDSAPVLEKPLAVKAGLGWIGKHTNLIHAQSGSWFFLGEIYVDLALPNESAEAGHCGTCQACIEVCPTQAIIAPYQLDARLCVSYLTIELKTAIPVALRPLLGNRIYGCDDCQLVCPWNRFARLNQDEGDFHPRQRLHQRQLLDVFGWDEATFLKKTEGSAIRRIGHVQWLRNIAVALGNSTYDPGVVAALEAKLAGAHALVQEHALWALAQLHLKGD